MNVEYRHIYKVTWLDVRGNARETLIGAPREETTEILKAEYGPEVKQVIYTETVKITVKAEENENE